MPFAINQSNFELRIYYIRDILLYVYIAYLQSDENNEISLT